MLALVGLLASMLHPNVGLQICFLGKQLATMLALQRREVLVLVIHDQTLLLLRNLLSAIRHPTAPDSALGQKREREVLKRHSSVVCLPWAGPTGSIFSRLRAIFLIPL